MSLTIGPLSPLSQYPSGIETRRQYLQAGWSELSQYHSPFNRKYYFMQLNLKLGFATGVILPYEYRAQLQAFVYSLLNSPEVHNDNKVKLFSYSPLQLLRNGAPEVKAFFPTVDTYFQFRTPMLDYLEKIASTIATNQLFRMGILEFPVTVSEGNLPSFTETTTWRSAPGSAIFTKEVTSSFQLVPETLEQKAKVRESLKHSLLTKFKALYERDLDAVKLLDLPDTYAVVATMPINICNIEYYKIAKGAEFKTISWGGFVTVEAPKCIQHAIYLLGLGTKTGSGYGFVNPVRGMK